MKFSFKSLNFEYIATWLAAAIFAALLGIAGYYIVQLMIPAPDDSKYSAAAVDAASIYDRIAGNIKSGENAVGNEAQLPVSEVAGEVLDKERTDAQAQRQWSYSAGSYAPAQWGKLSSEFRACSVGAEQSPVNIRDLRPGRELMPLQLSYGDFAGTLTNDARTIKIVPQSRRTISVFQDEYQLEYIEIHSPSEHRINNQKFDIELQFYHRNSDGKYLAIALLAKEGRTGNAQVGRLLEQIPTPQQPPTQLAQVGVTRLLEGDNDYIYYEGSLTSPPCSEEVRWIVLRKPVAVAAHQLDRALKSITFNARPIQALNGRLIYRSW